MWGLKNPGPFKTHTLEMDWAPLRAHPHNAQDPLTVPEQWSIASVLLLGDFDPCCQELMQNRQGSVDV